MANVKFPRKEFEKHMKLTDEVQEKINLFGTPFASANEEEIEIEIFPNRPDLLSMHGFLRSFKPFMGISDKKEYKINKPKKNYEVRISPSVKEIRPYTSCAIVEGIIFNEQKIKEIIDLQEKLHTTLGRNRKKMAIGIYPLDKISLPIRYEARSPKDINFIPLESSKKMNALEILKKHPKGKEYASLLENLNKFPVFIDNKEEILSMPPIINSEETGKITTQTNAVFVECSGSHLETLDKTLNIIVATLADFGGTVYQMNLIYAERKTASPSMSKTKKKISIENVNKIIGLEIKEKEIEKLLSRMGHEYENSVVYSPPWRTDVLHEIDLIEDIAIAYGYNNLVPEMPQVATTGKESIQSKITSKISDILIGLGMTEISTYHLIKQEEAPLTPQSKQIEVTNSKTEYKFLRQDLLTPALRILSANKDKDYPQELFEIGTVFSPDTEGNEETNIRENQNLIVVISPGNFTKIKQVMQYLSENLESDFEIQLFEKKGLIEGRTGKIIFEGEQIGYIGEIHPERLRDWIIKMPVAVLEISIDKIIKTLEKKYS